MFSRTFLFFVLILSGHFVLRAQDTTSNIYLKALSRIEKGDESFFNEISKDKNAGSNFAWYLCRAKIFASQDKQTAAFALYKKSLEIAKPGKEKSIANLKTGAYFLKLDMPVEALVYFSSAELAYNASRDPDFNVEIEKYIGIVYSYLGKKEKAIERFLRVYEYGKEKHSYHLESSASNNLGVSYIETGDFEKAEKFLEISLQLRLAAGDKKNLGQNYNNFGTLYFAKKDYKKALDYYLKGYDYRKEYLKESGGIMESEVNIGKTYLKLKNIPEAEKYLKMALDGGHRLGNLKIIYTSTEILRDLYREKNDFRNAFEVQNEYMAARDSLYGLEKREAVNRLSLENQFKSKILSDSVALMKQENDIRARESREKQNHLILGALCVVLLLVFFIVINLFRQNKKEQAKNILISKQASELKEQHKEIKDSFEYAQNLQQSLLPSEQNLRALPGENFILYLPKDIVSGDFYWSLAVDNTQRIVSSSPTAKDTKQNTTSKPPGEDGQLKTADCKLFYFALADCTGHGVPGSLVSVVGINALGRCINEFGKRNPADILSKLSDLVAEAFSQDDKQLRDGMDISLASIEVRDKGKYLVKWSGANNPLLVISKGKLKEWKGSRRPVGAFEKDFPFNEESAELETGDVIFMFSDGYGDQFGGEKGKKFKQHQLKDLLLSIHHLPLTEQKKLLAKHFNEWKGMHDQVDDVSVFGFRFG